jgi:pimeloyl-ACP methyl ester carboxylesterase
MLPDPVIEHLAHAHTDWERLFGDIRAFVETLPEETPSMLEGVSELDAPVLVSAVDRDDLFPLTVPLTLHRRLPNARLAILPGRHHALPRAPLSRLATELYGFFNAFT